MRFLPPGAGQVGHPLHRHRRKQRQAERAADLDGLGAIAMAQHRARGQQAGFIFLENADLGIQPPIFGRQMHTEPRRLLQPPGNLAPA